MFACDWPEQQGHAHKIQIQCHVLRCLRKGGIHLICPGQRRGLYRSSQKYSVVSIERSFNPSLSLFLTFLFLPLAGYSLSLSLIQATSTLTTRILKIWLGSMNDHSFINLHHNIRGSWRWTTAFLGHTPLQMLQHRLGRALWQDLWVWC